MLHPGDRIPDVSLRTPTTPGIEEVHLPSLFAGRTAVLFGVPGAFTPTCSDEHLPGFVAHAPILRDAGVDLIVCLAVNDAHVMAAWGKQRSLDGVIQLLADGNGEFTRRAGLELDLSVAGMGVRCRRFAAVLEDGVVRYLGVEPGRGVTVSSAAAVLAAF